MFFSLYKTSIGTSDASFVSPHQFNLSTAVYTYLCKDEEQEAEQNGRQEERKYFFMHTTYVNTLEFTQKVSHLCYTYSVDPHFATKFCFSGFFYVRELMRKGNAKVVCIPKCWHNFLLLFCCWNERDAEMTAGTELDAFEHIMERMKWQQYWYWSVRGIVSPNQRKNVSTLFVVFSFVYTSCYLQWKLFFLESEPREKMNCFFALLFFRG